MAGTSKHFISSGAFPCEAENLGRNGGLSEIEALLVSISIIIPLPNQTVTIGMAGFDVKGRATGGGTSDEPVPIDSVTVQVDSGPQIPPTLLSPIRASPTSPPAVDFVFHPTVPDDGPHQITVIATDANGITARQTVLVGIPTMMR